MFKSIFLPIIAVAAFITLVGLLSQGKLNFLLNKVNSVENSTQKTIKINDVEIAIEVARTSGERSKGLSNRSKLDEKSGMFFVFEKGSKPVFWMKDTKISLDLIWIKDGRVIGIEKKVQPEIGKKDSDLKRYPAPSAIDYVLEVNGGFSDKFNIKSGDEVSGLQDM